MRYIFEFPDIGEGIIEGKILEWHVKKGQEIKTGDPVVKMETDKVVTDIPSPKDGVIVSTFGKEGEVINVDDPLVEIEIEGVEGEAAQKTAKEKEPALKEESVDEKGFGVVGTLEVASGNAFMPSSDEGTVAEAAPAEQAAAEEEMPRKALATPVARAMAKDLGVDINKVKGTGPAGRVMKEDIKKYHAGFQRPAPVSREVFDDTAVEEVELTQIRKTIAKKMSESKQTAAHMTLMEEVEISDLVNLRETNKEIFTEHGIKLTYLPFVLKAAALALKEFPALNSVMDLDNNKMIYKKYYNLGIAVDTEDGLVVPVIKHVDKLSILEISIKINELAQKSRDRKLTMEDFKDGSFSVTNYGSIGGTFGVPVINYPQAAILGIGRILKTPVVKDDQVAVGHVLPLSLSVDHRIVDGGDAARFIKRVMDYLKNPAAMLMK